MPDTRKTAKKRGTSSAPKASTRTLKKRSFKRKQNRQADLLEWIVARKPQEVILIVAIVISVVGLIVALVVDARRGPNLPGWELGPKAYAAAMAHRNPSSPVLALYLYPNGCGSCGTFDRKFLERSRVIQALANDVLIRVNVNDGAGGAALAQKYAPKHYPALFILRPPPHPPRQINLHDANHAWITVRAFLKAYNWAVTWPDVTKGGMLNSQSED